MGRLRMSAQASRFRVANESIGGIKEIKLLGLESVAVQRYREPARDFAQAMAAQATLGQVPKYALDGLRLDRSSSQGFG